MRSRSPLILVLQGIIERTFDLDTGIDDLAAYVIGDEGLTRLYDGSGVHRTVGSGIVGPDGAHDAVGARTLLREEGGRLKACLYFPDRLVENLEANDPARILGDGNVDDFATLVEELDHLLTIADRHRAGAEMSLLELELHANVTKELMLTLFVARMRRRDQLGAADRLWVRHHLFHKIRYVEDDPGILSRYRDAASLAVRYLDALYGLPAAERLQELRRFHRRTHHEKLESIGRL